jgi:alcohol-forming fatty acyl-CoA reductase
LGQTKHPNTYTLSKALAEDVVNHYKDAFPTVIIRPSQVWSSSKEPFEGFVEGMNSGIGIICGAMTGFIRSMYACDKAIIKFSPADFVINATIVSAWRRTTEPEGQLMVYNCTDAETNPLEWREASKLVQPYFLKNAPYEKLVWYPNLNFTSSYIWHMTSLFLFQLLPAIFFDFILILSGRKRM